VTQCPFFWGCESPAAAPEWSDAQPASRPDMSESTPRQRIEVTFMRPQHSLIPGQCQHFDVISREAPGPVG